jgi:predicted nucleic acid-binding protein
MNIALDTNIIVYALAGDAQTASAASNALEHAASQGGAIIVSAPVYAELLAIPNWNKETSTHLSGRRRFASTGTSPKRAGLQPVLPTLPMLAVVGDRKSMVRDAS